MSSDRECRAESVTEEATTCRLATLKKRTQLDFEIDFFERILSRDPNYMEVLLHLGDLFARKGCHRRALQVDQRLAQLAPRSPMVHYNLACSHAVLNHPMAALEALRRAVQLGYADVAHLRQDPDLAELRTHPEFLRIVAELDGTVEQTRVV